jgi:iron complex outermembrane receptor protein
VNTKKIVDTGRGNLTLAAVIAATLGGAPMRADAQATGSAAASSSGIEEIIVTATRREEALQEVPLSVTALSTESLTNRGINNIGDLSAGKVPGFVPTRFSGGTTLAITVRGVGLSDPTQGTVEMPVPVYIDGVFLGRGQGLGIELIEPERVEILRGPQGQLFGRNAEGGVVQYVSRKPTGEFGIRASASYGNYNDQRIKASIDLPAVGGLSTQLSGVISSHDPYTEMSSRSLYPNGATPPGPPNEGHNVLETSGFRFAGRWQNDGGFTADYSYDYSDEFSSEGYLTWLDVDVARPAFALNEPTEDLPGTTFERLFNPGFQVYTSGHNLTLAWDMSDTMTLKSITSYREVARKGGNSLGTSLVAGGSSTGLIYTWAFEKLTQDQVSQELQLIGTWDQFDLTVGAMYFNEEVEDFRRSNLTGPGLTPPGLGINPALQYCVALALDPCPTTNALQGAESDSYGVYAQGNYRPAFASGLELTLGVRYTDDQKDGRRTQNNSQPVDQRAEFSASRVDPAASIKYEWSDDIQTYLRYATGYRAGGANVRSSNFTSFDEEENEAWELGLKSQWFDNRVQANLAVFHNTIKGEQLTIQETPTTNPSLTNTFNNPLDKKVKGAEIELYWAATDAIGIGGNYAFMDVDDYNEYDNPFTPTVVDISRFYNVSTPENSGSIFLDWDSNPSAQSGFFLHTDYAFAEGHYWTTPGASNIASFLPTFVRPESDMENWSARLGYRFATAEDGQFQVALWGKNLTDDSSIVYGFDGCASGGGHCAFRAAPRTYGVELRMEF